MCKQFKENRELMFDLVYELNEFTEKEITRRFLERNNSEQFITDYIVSTKEFLFSLCENEILKYDGEYFKVIPPERRLSYRMHLLGVMA